MLLLAVVVRRLMVAVRRLLLSAMVADRRPLLSAMVLWRLVVIA